jgi:hypothetical protein
MAPILEDDAGWEVEAVLAWHDDDPKAAIGALLMDIRHLRHQLMLASIAMSSGFTRGWMPAVTEKEALSGAAVKACEAGRPTVRGG